MTNLKQRLFTSHLLATILLSASVFLLVYLLKRWSYISQLPLLNELSYFALGLLAMVVLIGSIVQLYKLNRRIAD